MEREGDSPVSDMGVFRDMTNGEIIDALSTMEPGEAVELEDRGRMLSNPARAGLTNSTGLRSANLFPRTWIQNLRHPMYSIMPDEEGNGWFQVRFNRRFSIANRDTPSRMVYPHVGDRLVFLDKKEIRVEAVFEVGEVAIPDRKRAVFMARLRRVQ